MVSYHDLGIPARGNKDGVNTTAKRGREDVPDLEANQERVGHTNGSEASIAIIWGVGLKEVQIGKEGACIADEDGAERENRTDKTVLLFVSNG